MSRSVEPRPAPLRQRLQVIIVALCAIVVAISAVAFLTYDYFSFRSNLQHRLEVLTEVMGTQATPALAFNDPRVASEMLATLAAAPQILGGAVYSRNGTLFARFLRADAPDETIPSTAPSDGVHFEGGTLAIAKPMVADRERLGSVLLRSDLLEATDRMKLNVLIAAALLLVLLPLSYVLSDRMIRTITGPVAGMTEVVRNVTNRRDYALRATRGGPDEILVLVDGINDMLAQIQVRDGALQLARSELENRVAERTAELTLLNQELSGEVAERKRIELSLRGSEERYRQLVELSPDAILIHAEGKWLFVNSVAVRLLGAGSREDLIGTSIEDRIPTRFREAVRDRIHQIAGEGRTTTPLEQRMLRLDGSEIDVEVQGAPFYFENRPAVQIVVRDISKRKEIERMKDEFVSTVSHELRTPITSIQGSLGLIANGVLGALPPAVQPLVDIAYKNCSRLVLLINDILDSEKIAAGKMAYDFKAQELLPLVEQSVEINRAYAEQYGVRLELAPGPADARATVDADRIIQVLTNLISNAAKFSPRGEVVTVALSRADGRLRVDVRDRGPGIPDEFRDRIFQKFSQADSSDRRQKGGTGLGLSISKAIVEKHQGSLSFVSRTGAGTTFTLDVPEQVPAAAD